MKSVVWYQFGNPIKIAFRKHFCVFCGPPLKKSKHSKIVNSKSAEAQYYDFTLGETSIRGDCKFIHKIFYCPKCEKEIEPITQISYEDNEKWTKKAYNKLLQHFKPEQISKVWVDNNNNALSSMPDIENLQSILFVVTIGGKKFKIPCSITGRKKYWERPIYIKKDKCFYKCLADLKNYCKRLEKKVL